jgi:surface antigen
MSKFIKSNKLTAVISGIILCSTLISCETKQQSGGLIGGLAGAGAGALIGSSVGGTQGGLIGGGIGAILGGLAGSTIGQSMDERDRQRMQEANQRALERSKTGQTSSWKNPDSGNSGSIKTTRTFQNSGQYCREYTQTLTVGGKTEQGYGTACRQPDGSWQVQ